MPIKIVRKRSEVGTTGVTAQPAKPASHIAGNGSPAVGPPPAEPVPSPLGQESAHSGSGSPVPPGKADTLPETDEGKPVVKQEGGHKAVGLYLLKLPNRMHSVKETAEILNVCEKTVLRKIKAGLLQGQKIGRHWKIWPAAIAAFLATCAD